SDRHHAGRPPVEAARIGMEEPPDRAGRVVAHDQPRLEAEPLERLGLRLRVLAHAADVRPRKGNDDADLHAPTKSLKRRAWYPAAWKYELQVEQRHMRAASEPPSRLSPGLIASVPFAPGSANAAGRPSYQ